MDFGEDLTGFNWKNKRLEKIVLDKATLLPSRVAFLNQFVTVKSARKEE